MGERRARWSADEDRDALTLGEDEFLNKYPHRNFNSLRQRLEHLLGSGETYTQFRVRQDRERREIEASFARAPGMPEDLPEDPAALERLFTAMIEVHEAATALGGAPSKRLDWRPPDNRPVGIAFIGDIHAGAHIDYLRFEQDVKTIAETDGLYGVLMGDTVENTKPQSKSGTALYAAVMPLPGTQLAYAATRLRWARGKWLALLEGNHDGWDGRWAGIDRLPALANDIGAEYFTETGGSIFVHLGGVTYHLVCRHNHRGNSQLNKGNSARRLYDEWAWAFEHADVCVLGHTHEPHLEQTMRHGEIVTYLRSGTYKVNDEWAENQGWRSAYGVPVVVLWPGQRRIVAFHGAQFDEAIRYLAMVREAAAA